MEGGQRVVHEVGLQPLVLLLHDLQPIRQSHILLRLRLRRRLRLKDLIPDSLPLLMMKAEHPFMLD